MLHLNTFLSFIVNIYCDESITLTRSVSLDRFLLLILSSLKVNGSTLLFYQTSNSSHYSVALGVKRLVVPGVDASIRKQYTNGRMDEWTNGWMNERTLGWMDGLQIMSQAPYDLRKRKVDAPARMSINVNMRKIPSPRHHTMKNEHSPGETPSHVITPLDEKFNEMLRKPWPVIWQVSRSWRSSDMGQRFFS